MNSSRMKPLQGVAQKREDDAVAVYVERQQALARHEKRLADLRGYLAEYGKLKTEPQVGTLLRIRREFVDRLREIVTMEEAAVAQARLACDAERARWLAAHRSTEVLDRLAAHYRTQETRVAERHTQRESDEMATRLWLAAQGLVP